MITDLLAQLWQIAVYGSITLLVLTAVTVARDAYLHVRDLNRAMDRIAREWREGRQ